MTDEQTEQTDDRTLAEWLEDTLGTDDHGVVSCDGFDDCIIGVVESFGGLAQLLYDKQKMVAKMMERDGMTEEEAVEFFDFNIIGSYTSPQDPIYFVASAPKLRESIREDA
jgi:hypothetical protein